VLDSVFDVEISIQWKRVKKNPRLDWAVGSVSRNEV
jgi:hypothetical protein